MMPLEFPNEDAVFERDGVGLPDDEDASEPEELLRWKTAMVRINESEWGTKWVKSG